MTRSIVVWDREGDPAPASADHLWWRSFGALDSTDSVPRYLEVHAERIRAKYLAFIHDLGERRVAGRSVIEHLDLGDELGFWWMSTLAEKSPLKSPRIYDCLRMLALEEMVAHRRPSGLILMSDDPQLAQALQVLCDSRKIAFSWRAAAAERRHGMARRIYDALPYSIKGLLSFRHVLMRWPLRKLAKPDWFATADCVFICSYFIHLDPLACAAGRFHSRQWESLPDWIHAAGKPINWLHLFLFSAVVPDVATGLDWTRRFNAEVAKQGRHSFLDSFLSLQVVGSALRNWLRLSLAGWRLRHIHPDSLPPGAPVWLWPLLRSDWHTSLNGPVGLANCLAVAQFEAAIGSLPRQRTGLYLYENQAWEKAFLRAWRRHGHGRVVGVQHATAPFWHLYYFDDPRSLRLSHSRVLPLPDLVAVNGAAAKSAFLAAGFPEPRLIEVEALRYMGLAGLVAARASATAAQEAQSSGGALSPVRVLILGDMIPVSVRHLLGLAEAACESLPSEYEFTFKAHPGYAVALVDFPGLTVTETREPLGQILAGFDLAIAANSTSAAVDAYVAGLRVVIAVDADELNLSPLRGRAGVRFVSSAQELIDELLSARLAPPAADSGRESFFHLDPSLPRWRQFLAQDAST